MGHPIDKSRQPAFRQFASRPSGDRRRGPDSRLVDLLAAVMLLTLVVLALGLVRQTTGSEEPIRTAGVDHHVGHW